MRNDELREVDLAVSVEEKVEVERPWAVRFAQQQPPRLGLEALEEPEQVEGRQKGSACGDSVQKIGLWRSAYGRREVNGGAGESLEVRREAR